MGGDGSGRQQDRNPLKPEACKCDRPVETEVGCMHCGREIADAVPVKLTPAQRVVVLCIEAWVNRHGQPPRQRDWRQNDGTHPSLPQVKRLFGSWRAAILAAGFRPDPRGGVR